MTVITAYIFESEVVDNAGCYPPLIYIINNMFQGILLRSNALDAISRCHRYKPPTHKCVLIVFIVYTSLKHL